MMSLKRFAPFLTLGAALLVSGCDMIKEAKQEASGESAVRRRLNAIFEPLRTEGLNTSIPIQTAICQWWEGKGLIRDLTELSRASDRFTGWARQKNLHNKFGSYYIASLTKSGNTWFATVVVDGRSLRMEIPRDQPIKWVD